MSKDDRVDARYAVKRTPERKSSDVLHSTFDGNDSEHKDAKLMTVLDMSDINSSPRKLEWAFFGNRLDYGRWVK